MKIMLGGIDSCWSVQTGSSIMNILSIVEDGHFYKLLVTAARNAAYKREASLEKER